MTFLKSNELPSPQIGKIRLRFCPVRAAIAMDLMERLT
jgi:hypothetical protein